MKIKLESSVNNKFDEINRKYKVLSDAATELVNIVNSLDNDIDSDNEYLVNTVFDMKKSAKYIMQSVNDNFDILRHKIKDYDYWERMGV